MTTLAGAAEALAQRHQAQEPAATDEDRSLVNYAEAPHAGDWSLRSALVRLAQPHPRRAEAVLDLVRRLDHALAPMTREIQRRGVITQRTLPRPDGTQPVPDGRTVDLAVLIEDRPGDAVEVIDGYERVTELSEIERGAVPLLACALVFDRLAGTLAGWASSGWANPPITTIDRACRSLLECLDTLGVPVEARPATRPPRSRSERR